MESLESIFGKLYNTWRQSIDPASSMIQNSLKHWAYQEIIKLGQPAVPLILQKMEENSDVWLCAAIRQITGENPVSEEDRGRVLKMLDAWLNWGRERGFLSN